MCFYLKLYGSTLRDSQWAAWAQRECVNWDGLPGSTCYFIPPISLCGCVTFMPVAYMWECVRGARPVRSCCWCRPARAGSRPAWPGPSVRSWASWSPDPAGTWPRWRQRPASWWHRSSPRLCGWNSRSITVIKQGAVSQKWIKRSCEHSSTLHGNDGRRKWLGLSRLRFFSSQKEKISCSVISLFQMLRGLH